RPQIGEYIRLHWDDGPLWYAVRGHVGPEEARATVAREEGFGIECVKPGRHTRARWQFPEAHQRYDGADIVLAIDVSGPGTFPVTVCEPVNG
ncbi:MAG TPA: hypothetical protein VM223_01445, partial [Planctomycetota bacterium]|nr:hypothetical protein [Planctomycetota bacterium]